MAIVKRRKKHFYTMENEIYDEVVKINLNKNDEFEIAVPEHYAMVLSEVKDLSFRHGHYKDGFLRFDSLKHFDDLAEELNIHFRDALFKREEEKVLVIHVEAQTLNGVDNKDIQDVDRLGCHSFFTPHTFLNVG